MGSFRVVAADVINSSSLPRFSFPGSLRRGLGGRFLGGIAVRDVLVVGQATQASQPGWPARTLQASNTHQHPISTQLPHATPNRDNQRELITARTNTSGRNPN